MFGAPADRLKGREASREAAAHRAEARARERDRLKGYVALMTDLLRDPRYEAYTALLRESRAVYLAEREALLRDRTDRDAREHLAAILTGRLAQLDAILTTPEQFLRLAEQLEADDTAPRGALPGA